jgi:hypothetical protein
MMTLLASAAASVPAGRNPAMHIPDGFLSVTVSLVFWALSAMGVGSCRFLTAES